MGFTRPQSERTGLPWSEDAPARGVVFATLWATGPDPSVDGIFRLQAARRAADGALWESYLRHCNPFPRSHLGLATARMEREYGVGAALLEGAPPAADVIGEWAAFLGSGPVLVQDSGAFRAWWQHLGGPAGLEILGLEELRGLLRPGERAGEPVREPADLQRELAELVGRFLAQGEDALELAAAGWLWAWERLRGEDGLLARALALALTLVEHPGAWARSDGLFPLHEALAPGRMTAALGATRLSAAGERARRVAERMTPRCAQRMALWTELESVPVDAGGLEPLAPADLALIDDVFQVHLPAHLGEGRPGRGAYREGQHKVAREVARTLGNEELLLVCAPTGTGKTLAYLVPALVWSVRQNVRVGVSTYTRTLQEQASEHEVPAALRVLARAGLGQTPRVSLLKGRANYLCWRALRVQAPLDEERPQAWLAWVALCLFAAGDDEGDLDRFPQRLELCSAGSRESEAAAREELGALLRNARAQAGCCQARDDRETCAAELARERAERSHVVITNHAFTLLRQTFFRHVVFDECEHLHEQAHGAWSHMVALRALQELFTRMSQPRQSPARAPLDRLRRMVMEGSRAHEALDEARAAAQAGRTALLAFERALDGFKEWRLEAQRQREERDQHSLLREFVELAGEEPAAAGLVERFRALDRGLAQLDGALAALAGFLDEVPARGVPRLRRTLERLRGELVETVEGLHAWLPMQDGRPRFLPETFHDVEEDPRGGDVLAARVLLPNEYLGRNFYPQLSSAVLLSATTHLRGGFDSAMGYLGLDRAAEPADDEEREPCRVRTYLAPDPFDYGRVLVCVPKDAPGYKEGRQAFLVYVRRFIAHLGELTRGRMLVLFTNAEDVRRTGEDLVGHFRARRIPLWFQGMPGMRKEELGELFRRQVDSILLGVDTFWFGADFPGETLEYLVIVKLPYGVPDRYHHAQCAALGTGEQRKRIYMPRALAKLRQGFGRLMRRESDRGCVFLLDGRVLTGAGRAFLEELPLCSGERTPLRAWRRDGARLLIDDSDACVRAALAHMGMLADVERRGMELELGSAGAHGGAGEIAESAEPGESPRARELLDIPVEDLPF